MGARHGPALDVAADAAAGNHAVLQRHAAEGHDDLGLRGHLLPRDVAPHQVLVIAQDMRHQHRGCAGAVAIDGADVAAQRRVQKAVNLALGVMEAARARPTVGAAEDGARAVTAPHPRQLAREQVEHAIPFHGHERVATAHLVRTRPALQPAPPDHWLRDAGAMPERAGEVLEEPVRVRVGRMRADLQPVLSPAGREGAPMRGVGPEVVDRRLRSDAAAHVLTCLSYGEHDGGRAPGQSTLEAWAARVTRGECLSQRGPGGQPGVRHELNS